MIDLIYLVNFCIVVVDQGDTPPSPGELSAKEKSHVMKLVNFTSLRLFIVLIILFDTVPHYTLRSGQSFGVFQAVLRQFSHLRKWSVCVCVSSSCCDL